MEGKIRGPNAEKRRNARMRILDALKGEKSNFTELRKMIGPISKPVLSQHLDRLEKEGLIFVETSTEDKRQRIYGLTEIALRHLQYENYGVNIGLGINSSIDEILLPWLKRKKALGRVKKITEMTDEERRQFYAQLKNEFEKLEQECKKRHVKWMKGELKPPEEIKKRLTDDVFREFLIVVGAASAHAMAKVIDQADKEQREEWLKLAAEKTGKGIDEETLRKFDDMRYAIDQRMNKNWEGFLDEFYDLYGPSIHEVIRLVSPEVIYEKLKHVKLEMLGGQSLGEWLNEYFKESYQPKLPEVRHLKE